MRVRTKTLALVGLGALLLGISWVLRQPPRLDSGEVRKYEGGVERGVEGVDQTVLTPPSDAKSSRVADRATPDSQPDTQTQETSSNILSGYFCFADGSAPPEMGFEISVDPGVLGMTYQELTTESALAEARGECRRRAMEQTDARGHFRVSGLCPGVYGIRLSTFSGLGEITSTVSVPSKNVRVQIDGYMLRIRVVDEKGDIAPHALVTGSFAMDAIAPGSDTEIVQIERLANDEGVVVLPLSRPGILKIEARQGTDYSPVQELVIEGPSYNRNYSMALTERNLSAAVRVVISACGAVPIAIDDYCIVLYDAATSQRAARICSENEDADGVIRGVVPGQYVSAIARRYQGALDYFLDGADDKRIPVDLKAGGETELRFCVPIGGRLSLLVNEVEPRSTQASQVANVRVVNAAGDQSWWLEFRAPDDTGVTVDGALPFGVERVGDVVFPEGTYSVIVRAQGYMLAQHQIQISAGQISRVVASLTREDN